MKSLIRIPTTQYGYLEIEFEGTQHEIINKHNELIELYSASLKPKIEPQGIPELEFNKLLDKYLETAKMQSSEYESLGTEQKNIIQTLKRAFKRAEAHNQKII